MSGREITAEDVQDELRNQLFANVCGYAVTETLLSTVPPAMELTRFSRRAAESLAGTTRRSKSTCHGLALPIIAAFPAPAV